MTRRHKVDEINLGINYFSPFINDKYVGFYIDWASDIGFGEYTIYRPVDSDKWMADSEHMDSNEDKDFIKELLKLLVEELNIVN